MQAAAIERLPIHFLYSLPNKHITPSAALPGYMVYISEASSYASYCIFIFFLSFPFWSWKSVPILSQCSSLGTDEKMRLASKTMRSRFRLGSEN
jgi:hypothetical protein